MKCECAWCGTALPSVEADNLPDHAVTHGICDDCGNQLLGEVGTPLYEFLEDLAIPVGIVNSNAQVVWASTAMCSLVGKEPANVEGRLGGDVFDCVHARTPQGCGNTIHCSGCTIRKAVTTTFKTGRSCVRIPAALKAARSGETPEIEMYVTTQKVDDVVLLRVDPTSTDTVEIEELMLSSCDQP